jgi:RNA polymerase sigma-70 factor (ECF subfamily)
MQPSSANKPCIAKKASVKNDTKLLEDLELSLIARTVAGDEDAFERLYSLYYSRLSRFVYRTTGRLDIIDEVINDVMYVVWQKASTYDQSCRLSTWIFGIAYNKARVHNSPSRLQANQDSIDDVSEGLLPGGDNWIEQLETENWLANAFDVLSVEQRVVVELTYYHGMHYQEIALLMGCHENTVKTRMFHGRKKLASALEQHALTTPQ